MLCSQNLICDNVFRLVKMLRLHCVSRYLAYSTHMATLIQDKVKFYNIVVVHLVLFYLTYRTSSFIGGYAPSLLERRIILTLIFFT